MNIHIERETDSETGSERSGANENISRLMNICKNKEL